MKKYFNQIFGVSAFLIIIYFLLIDEPEQVRPDQKQINSVTQYEAKAVAEGQILPLLKSPMTAEFSGVGETVFVPIQNGYNVTGFVDSQNGFGAIVRTHYRVDIVTGKDGKFYYQNLKVD